MKNILLLSHSGSLGGASNTAIAMARGLRAIGNVFCAMPSVNRGVGQAMTDAGVHVRNANLHWYGGGYDNEIRNIISKEKIDAVISNTVTICDGAIAAFKENVPHYWYIHEILSQDQDLNPPVGLDELYGFVTTSGTVATASHAVSREIQKYIPSAECTVIYRGIESKPLSRVEARNPLVLTVGGICRRKGQMVLVRAAANVLESIPNALFVSYGGCWDKEYFSELVAERRKLGIRKGQFSFRGFSYDIGKEYDSATVFALASQCEPFGLVLVEAMRAGVPVVSTRSGGPEEIIEHGKTGFLCDPSDHVQMAYHIKELINNKDESARIAAAGKAHQEMAFRQDDFIDKWIRLIGER